MHPNRKLPPPPLRSISFAIPDDLLDRLDTLAMISRTPRSQLLREATELMLDLHDGPAEVLEMLIDGFASVYGTDDPTGEPKASA